MTMKYNISFSEEEIFDALREVGAEIIVSDNPGLRIIDEEGNIMDAPENFNIFDDIYCGIDVYYNIKHQEDFSDQSNYENTESNVFFIETILESCQTENFVTSAAA